MRWIAVVVMVVLGIAVAQVSADPGGAGQNIPAPPSACDECSDLCRLVDQYEQKAKIAELFRQYAEASVGGEQQMLPLNPQGVQVSSMNEFETAVQREFDAWTKTRVVPCQHPPAAAAPFTDATASKPTPPAKGGAPADEDTSSTQLETNTAHEKDSDPELCQVLYDHAPLTPATIPKFEAQYNCKPISDALQEHEQVHVRQCQKAYAAMPGKAGADFLADPRNVANAETKAYGREKDIVANQIRKIVREKGCGWHPTKPQQKRSKTPPSGDEITKMFDRGWKAAKALGGKGRK